MNINPEYIKKKYNEISNTYEEHKKRKPFYDNGIIKFLKKYINEDSSVIDIGCGTGRILRKLNPKYGIGIDISDGMIEKAEKYNQRKNLKFLVGDIENLKITQKFDFILLIDMFAYVRDTENALGEIKKLCKKNTRVIMFSFNPFFLFLIKILEKFKLKTPDPIERNLRNKKELINLFKKMNYKIDYIKYNVYFLLITIIAKPIDF